ncbi:ras-related protein Rab-26-like isoform X4 [Silurus meridionalis]|uniref:ras-related protein Rab-26-like isoform X4 n=1 Tax=Silurus meridionalis TaxID=175797 RepID=UPI001EEBD477|nr:ras-related protein Rab-26-like isoform X4 [Silurus meridionalis]
MSTKKMPMSDNELKNGTSRNMLERCASVNEYFDISFKVMLLGDSAVGKTCVLVRFKDGAFLGGNFIATVGIDFRNKVVSVDNMKVKLQIWDTAGQERFRSVTHAYYRDAQALLLLYDITRKSSFDNIRAWLTEIHEYAQKDVVIMLLGNKTWQLNVLLSLKTDRSWPRSMEFLSWRQVPRTVLMWSLHSSP